nr:MAG TPA: hypothetical protein [Caudoviricetes sp.]
MFINTYFIGIYRQITSNCQRYRNKLYRVCEISQVNSKYYK